MEQSNVKGLGYYAMDKDNNLFQFQWGIENGDNTFYINDEEGDEISNLGHKMRVANAEDYEIIQVGMIVADD